MKKTIKRIIQTVLALLVIVIGAAFALVYFVDPNQYRDRITAKVSESLAQELRINGELRWSLWPSFALELNQVELDNPQHFEPRNMLKAKQIVISLELAPLLNRELAINRIDLRNAELTIVTRPDGISNLDHILGSGPSTKDDQDTGLRSGPVRLENVILTLIDQKTNSVQVLEIEQAQLDFYAANEELPFSIDADLYDAGNPVLTDFHATGNVLLPSDNSPILLSKLQLAGALSGLGDDFRLDGAVSIDTRNGLLVELRNASGQLNGNRFQLEASLRSGDTSTIGFDLSGKSLDLDSLLGGDGSADDTGSSLEEDLDWLKTTNLNGRINFDSVSFNQIDLKALSARITSKGGNLVVAPFSASAFGGRIEGSLQVNLNQTPVSVRFSPIMSDIDIGAISEHLTGTRLVEASGDLAMDLSGDGLDPSALLKTLSGSGEYALGSGELLGMDMNALIDEILGAQSLQGFDRAFSGTTSFNLMSGELVAERGILKTPGLLLQSDSFDISGSGNINLATENLDYRLRLQLKGALKDKLAAKAGVLEDGLIPLKISGSLVAPSISFDTSSLVQRRVESALDKNKDELKTKIFGHLFGKDNDTKDAGDPDG